MANELKHLSVGSELTQAEWESITTHVLNAQAIGDFIYASSATQLSRLAIGPTDTYLRVVGGVPTWSSTFNNITMSGTWLASGIVALPAFSAGGNISLGSYWLSGDGGDEGIRIDSTGRVGIQGAATSFALSVRATALYGTDGTGSFILYDAISTGKKMFMGYDATLNAGFIQAAETGVAWRNIYMQPNGGSLMVGMATVNTGSIGLGGSTSGTVTFTVAAIAGTWTMTLPTTAGSAGQQLQTDGAGITSWQAAGCLPEFKNPLEFLSPLLALTRILENPPELFTYRPDSPVSTGDFEKIYAGPNGRLFPEVMHHKWQIFDPVSAFGYTVGAIQAINAPIWLKQQVRLVLEDAEFKSWLEKELIHA